MRTRRRCCKKPAEQKNLWTGTSGYWLGIVILFVIVSGNAVVSAEASEPQALGAVDWARLVASVLWFVAVVYLAFLRFTVPQRRAVSATETLRFSPLALAGLGALFVTGILSADQIVINPTYMFASPWGQTLLFGLVALAALLLLSLIYVWNLGRKAKGSLGPQVVRAMRRTSLFETILALAVAAMMIVLVFFGLPSDSQYQQSGPLVDVGDVVDERGITLAGDADPLFLTLQSVPNRAGHNELTVTVVDWREPDSLYQTDVVMHLTSETGERQTIVPRPEPELVTMSTGQVGRTYVATTEQPLEAGRWHVDIVLDRPGGEVLDASFVLPVAEDPLLILERADKALAEVSSARMTESLGGAGVAMVSDYVFMPDRMHIVLDSGFERIVIGNDLYERWPGEEWRKKRWPAGPFAFPMYSYVDIASDVKLLDVEEIDGRPHYRVQFIYEPTGTYYEVWADVENYRTRKLTMMAPAHYMIWHYSEYDAAVQIEPPEM